MAIAEERLPYADIDRRVDQRVNQINAARRDQKRRHVFWHRMVENCKVIMLFGAVGRRR